MSGNSLVNRKKCDEKLYANLTQTFVKLTRKNQGYFLRINESSQTRDFLSLPPQVLPADHRWRSRLRSPMVRPLRILGAVLP
jgi:hypothetical protein